MEGLTEGRMVHYVLSEWDESTTVKPAPNQGEHRPAVVVKVWGASGTSNLQVFTDSDPKQQTNDCRPPLMWKTSVVYDETGKPGTWHWIERA
jgi:hypothetical protein